MNKLNPIINQKKARSSATSRKGPYFGKAMDYCEYEIRPVLELLHEKETPEIIKKSLRRFLIVSLVSTFEFYFRI